MSGREEGLPLSASSVLPCGYEPSKEVRKKNWGGGWMMSIHCWREQIWDRLSTMGEMIEAIGQSDAGSQIFFFFHHDRRWLFWHDTLGKMEHRHALWKAGRGAKPQRQLPVYFLFLLVNTDTFFGWTLLKNLILILVKLANLAYIFLNPTFRIHVHKFHQMVQMVIPWHYLLP